MKTEAIPSRSDFFEAVYDVVRSVPRGRVTTYGAIAKYLGSGQSSRMVGYALNAAIYKDVPAHRVVNRLGLLTGAIHFPADDPMEDRLAREGVRVEDGKIHNFEDLLWDPARDAWPDTL